MPQEPSEPRKSELYRSVGKIYGGCGIGQRGIESGNYRTADEKVNIFFLIHFSNSLVLIWAFALSGGSRTDNFDYEIFKALKLYNKRACSSRKNKKIFRETAQILTFLLPFAIVFINKTVRSVCLEKLRSQI